VPIVASWAKICPKHHQLDRILTPNFDANRRRAGMNWLQMSGAFAVVGKGARGAA